MASRAENFPVLQSVLTPDREFTSYARRSIGVLIYWWQANKTQSGRGTITLTAIPELPVYDFEKLSPGQLTKADAIFDEFLTKPLRPTNELHLDKVRCLRDEALMVEVLGLPKSLMAPEGPFDLFRRKLGAEPSITGGKKRQLSN